MHLRLKNFAGTLPRLHSTKLPEVAAQSCNNVVTEHGILSPVKKAMDKYYSNTIGQDTFLSAIFFEHNSQTYKKFADNVVKFAFSPVHESYRLYWSDEQENAPLRFVDWNEDDSGNLTSDNFEYLAGMPAPDVKDMAVTGIVKGPATESDGDAPIEEGTIISGDQLLSYLSSKEFAQAFQLILDQKNTSLVAKKENDLSDTLADAINIDDVSKEARVYAFTYVNRFGDESAPGVNENILYIQKGDKPVLSIPYSSGAREALIRDYGITAIRLYRSVTDSVGRAQFLFVKEVVFSATGDSFVVTDDIPQGSLLLGEPLVTVNYDQPRDNLKGLGVTTFGVGYGYVDKTICFSEPYLLYAWPRFYELSSQHTIMGIGHYDNTIAVATTGNPILINGDAPESMGAYSLPLYEGCVSTRSMVNLNYGCMYASENGLVLLTSNSAKLFTEGMFATDDWQKINPASIHACAYKGGYLFFWQKGGEKGSGYIDINNPSAGVLWFDDYALNTFLNKGVVQMINKGPDPFNVVKSNYIAFNPEYGQASDNKRFVWRSKTFTLNAPKRMLAGQVVADDYRSLITFRVYADGALLHTCIVNDERAFRITNHSAKRDFSIEVESSTPIREIALGETMRDLIL